MFFARNSQELFADKISKAKPSAQAKISGSEKYPRISGTVSFYSTFGGTVVSAEIFGLPHEKEKCGDEIFAFHIHEGVRCSGNAEDPFAGAGAHFNPEDCSHPHHAGDMPPLFGCGGFAWLCFFTDRFTVDEVLGRAVIVHRNPDDFTTQPSGNAGEKIACGVIRKL